MPKINKLVIGIAAILLAVIGQNRLQEELLFDAALFYGVGIILFVAFFFRSALPELSLSLADAEEERWLGLPAWSQQWWWQSLLFLLFAAGISLGTVALYKFREDFYRPAADAWPLYLLSLLCLLLYAALADGAPYALWWLTSSYLRRPAAVDPGYIPLAPARLIWRALRVVFFLFRFYQ